MYQYVQQWIVLNCCIISNFIDTSFKFIPCFLMSEFYFVVIVISCGHQEAPIQGYLSNKEETDRRKSRYQPYFWLKLHKEHGSGMQLFEIPKAVAGIKQFPKNAQTGLGNHSLPSEGKPSHKSSSCRKLMRAYTLHRKTFQSLLKVGFLVKAESISETLHTYYPTAEEGGTDILPTATPFVIVTGSNGITLFGLHFPLCKFFRISIGHLYFFSSDCFNMPFIHFPSKSFIFLFICKMQTYSSKSLFLILELWCIE